MNIATLQFRRRAARAAVALLFVPLWTIAGTAAAFQTSVVAPGQERIAWPHPGLSPQRHGQIVTVGPWERTDYALFAGPAGQGELLFKTANPGEYALTRPRGVQHIAESWNHLRGRIRQWFPGRSNLSHAVDLVYRRAALVDGRTCVVFYGEGDIVTPDPEKRPGTIYFGYFCARDARAFDDAAAFDVINALVLDRSPGRPFAARGSDSRAEAIARGSLASRSGNARYPFPLGIQFTSYDGPGRRF